MRSPENFEMSQNQSLYTKDGQKVVTLPVVRQMKGNASETAMHEAEHVAVAIENGTAVKSVTITPGKGYMGQTELSRPDPLSAVAAYSNGRRGTDHDVTIARLMGYNPDSLAPIARSITKNKRKHIIEIANELDLKKTLSGGAAENIMRKVYEKKTKPKPVNVFIYELDGTQKTYKTHSNGKVVIRKEWVQTRNKPIEKDIVRFPGQKRNNPDLKRAA